MVRYLIVDSRDLTEYTSGRYVQKVAGTLADGGNEVTLFLIENGVIAARQGGDVAKDLTALSQRGVKVMTDDISCNARGITRLAEGITPSSMDHLADLITEGSDKVVWY